MNRIMLLGLLVRISRVALCGVMGVMAETVARRAAGPGIAIPVVLVRLILEPRELFVFVQQRRRLLVRAVAIHQQRRLILGWLQFRPAHRHWRQRRPCPERAQPRRAQHLTICTASPPVAQMSKPACRQSGFNGLEWGGIESPSETINDVRRNQ